MYFVIGKITELKNGLELKSNSKRAASEIKYSGNSINLRNVEQCAVEVHAMHVLPETLVLYGQIS